VRLGTAVGAWGETDLARRGTMVIFGLFFALTGNAMPKTLTPLAALQCNPAKVQAFQRFAGWTWVLTGLVFAMVWLVMPVGVARPASVGLLVVAMVAIVTQIVRLRASRSRGEAL
jgi:hypothetical protein